MGVVLLVVYASTTCVLRCCLALALGWLQMFIMIKLGAYRRRSAKHTDKRVKMENEALGTIRYAGLASAVQGTWHAHLVCAMTR